MNKPDEKTIAVEVKSFDTKFTSAQKRADRKAAIMFWYAKRIASHGYGEAFEKEGKKYYTYTYMVTR